MVVNRLDAKPEHRRLAMEQLHWREAQAMHINGALQIDDLRNERGHERVVDVLFALEDVLVYAKQMLHGVSVSKNLNRRFHHGVESTHFIETERVIHVIVREDDGIASIQSVTKRLHSQVRRRIDQHQPRLAVGVSELNAR
jgi:hypothetical protein